MAVVVTPCPPGTAEGIPAGKCKWEYQQPIATGGGWVLQGCNCPGMCCEAPPAPGRINEVRIVPCVACPLPNPGDLPTNPGPDDPPTDPGPPDEKKKKK